MTAHQLFVGQDVVCVEAAYRPEQHVSIPCELVEGAVYKIRWIGPYNSYADGEFIGVKVEGVYRGTCPTYGEDDPPFHSRRFRPLVRDRLGSLRALQNPNQPLAPAPEEPKRRVTTKEEEKV